MKKNYLILLILFFSLNSFSQIPNSGCQFNYSVKLIQPNESLMNKEKFVTLDWDFSRLNVDFSKTSIVIEIVPIYDCNKELEGVRFKEPIVFSNSASDFEQKKSIKIVHTEMMAKCFKYRVKIISNCEEVSEWRFYSFIN